MNRSIAVTALACTATLLAAGPAAACDAAAKTASATCGASTTAAMARTVGWTADRSKMDIVDTAVSAGSFKTLAAALQAAGLVDALKGDGPFTVFAPTDAAFAKLPKGTVASLLKPENKDKLTAILTYHVVAGAVPASRVVNMTNATTLNGQRVDIAVNDKGVMIDNATVAKTDIMCRNGIIHVIDAVILPVTDSIVDVAASAGKFQTLIAAVEAAGLAETLMGPGPFTVLAPTDAAFAKLPQGTVASLLEPKNRAKLVDLLTYHVIPGRVFARDAVTAERFETVQGESVRFGVRDGRLTVDGAGIVGTDIEASNGVIFVIDRVIMPSGK